MLTVKPYCTRTQTAMHWRLSVQAVWLKIIAFWNVIVLIIMNGWSIRRHWMLHSVSFYCRCCGSFGKNSDWVIFTIAILRIMIRRVSTFLSNFWQESWWFGQITEPNSSFCGYWLVVTDLDLFKSANLKCTSSGIKFLNVFSEGKAVSSHTTWWDGAPLPTPYLFLSFWILSVRQDAEGVDEIGCELRWGRNLTSRHISWTTSASRPPLKIPGYATEPQA